MKEKQRKYLFVSGIFWFIAGLFFTFLSGIESAIKWVGKSNGNGKLYFLGLWLLSRKGEK